MIVVCQVRNVWSFNAFLFKQCKSDIRQMRFVVANVQLQCSSIHLLFFKRNKVGFKSPSVFKELKQLYAGSIFSFAVSHLEVMNMHLIEPILFNQSFIQ